MRTKHILIHLSVVITSLCTVASCDLTETQKSTADAAIVFGSETGLRSYCFSFYGLLPSGTSAHHMDDQMAEYMAKASLNLYETGGLTSDSQSSWDWSDIRNVNYFLDHNNYSSVSQQVRDNYNGIARFFRAWLYYEKLLKYGEVPWIGRVLNPGDPELTAPRDSRDVIIRHIIEDCDFAFEHIQAEDSRSSNACLLNRWCALLLKSRACLFEASWRKYHAGSVFVDGCEITADKLFSAAAEAAFTIMHGSPFSLHTGTVYSNGRGSYRDLFSSDVVPTDEVMLAIQNDASLSVGYANYYYNVQATAKASLTRPFMNSYLNIDGSYYSETKPDGSYKTFLEETSGRDLRLNQTIRAYDYTCKNGQGQMVPMTPDFGYTLTGYHITKFTVDDVACNVYGANGNDIPVMRYAEVLLNYAEAKAELNDLSKEEWKATIGALRRRAGITGGALDDKPTTVDPYLQANFYPGISDPVILEIRRERTCELCLEGFRENDLKRWACGNLWKDALWTGIFIPALDTPLDLNGDGVYDVYFSDAVTPAEYSNIAVSITAPLRFLSVVGGKILQDALTGRTWKDQMYLQPIATVDITSNPNLLPNNPEY